MDEAVYTFGTYVDAQMDRSEVGHKKDSARAAARVQALQRVLSYVPPEHDQEGNVVEVEGPPARGLFRDPAEMMSGLKRKKG